jgi:hypothetical protein
MNRLRKNLCYGLHSTDDIMHVSMTVIEERDTRRGCKQYTCSKMTQQLLIGGSREMKQEETSNK